MRLTGFKGRVRWNTSKPDGQPGRCLDGSLPESELDFRARTSFEEGPRRTIEAYRRGDFVGPPIPEEHAFRTLIFRLR